MKKINILLATLAMLVATVSCNNDDKIQTEELGVPAGSIRVNIAISDLQPTTKAVKKGWADGDIINIWFDNKVFQTPELTMTYNNGAWVASQISDEVVNQLKTNGTIWGFYEASNSATTAWTFGDSGKSGYVANFETPESNWTVGTYGYLTVKFQNISYTFDGTTLSANLNNWTFGTDFQMVITGLDNTKTWTLKSAGIVNWYGIQMWLEGENHDEFNMWYYLGGSNRPMYGMPNDDGLAFYGRLESSDNSAQNHTFTLTNVTDNVTYTLTKNAQISTNHGATLFAAKVPFGRFSIDMGNGLKWAVSNLGADNPWDYGDYFAWAATTPYYEAGYAQENPQAHWREGKSSGYYWSSYPFMQSGQKSSKYITKYTYADGKTSNIYYKNNKFKGDNGDGVEHKDFASYDYVDDPARYNLGGTWRTPTKQEWDWLISNCTWVSTSDYNGSGVKGYIVTSKIEGFQNNSIFIPAAGSYSNKLLGNDGYCYYWSASLADTSGSQGGSHRAWSFSSLMGPKMNSTERQFGNTIRPVCE